MNYSPWEYQNIDSGNGYLTPPAHVLFLALFNVLSACRLQTLIMTCKGSVRGCDQDIEHECKSRHLFKTTDSIALLNYKVVSFIFISLLGPWGRCMGNECGPGGSQSRAVWCAHSEGWTTLHTNCQQSERPSNQQSCFRVCDWHKELYDWQLGAWNQCVPVSMRSAGVPRPAVCTRGEEGIQTREVGCVHKSDGVPAEDAICEYFEPKPRLEQACLIPCPRDCVVSEFSPWTSCSKSCGMGLQNRLRLVLAPPLFGGSACPNLTEFRTCQPGQCEGEESLHSLRVGPWGPCTTSPIRQARETQEAKEPKRERKAKRDRQARQERQGKRRKNKEKKEVKENKGERVRDRARAKGKMRDPETRELIKNKRTRNRQNRQGLKFWDLQVGFQTREVTCVHRSGSTAEFRSASSSSSSRVFMHSLVWL